MTLHVSVSGVNKRVLGIWVGVGGAWKKVLTGHTSVTGVYKKFFSAGDVVSPLAGGTVYSIVYNGADNTSSMTLNANGSISALTDGVEVTNTVNGTRWFTDTPYEAYEAYATLVSTTGTGTTTGTFLTWLPLSGSPSWSVYKAGGTNGVRTSVIKIQIRKAGGAVVSPDTFSYNLSAAVNTGVSP